MTTEHSFALTGIYRNRYVSGSGLYDNREFYYVIVNDNDIRVEFDKGYKANDNELKSIKENLKKFLLPQQSWNHANPVEGAVALS